MLCFRLWWLCLRLWLVIMAKLCKQIVLGYDGDGKQIRKRIYADGKRELQNRIDEAKAEYKRLRNPSSITFAVYSEKWLEVYKANRSANTRAMYSYSLNQCSDLRPIPIRDITRTDLQAVINEHTDSPRFCQQIRLTLKQVFNAAIADGHIIVNPADHLELPKYKAKEKRSLTDEERRKIKETELPEQHRLLLDLFYYFGLRRGEALAVRGSDFDFKALLLYIDKSIAFNGNHATVKDTKTHVARYVPIPAAFRRTLPEGELFPDISASRYHKMWHEISEALGMGWLTAHMLRHDYATRLYYAGGISNKKKAAILGHEEALFLRLYSHLDNEQTELENFHANMTF